MVLSCASLIRRDTGSSRLFTRLKGLAAIGIIGLCSILYLTWFLPGFSVKNELGRLLPTVSVTNGTHMQWNNKPRRLIVFGDSWSDNGVYPVDPPSKDQMPDREEARGMVWTEWLCSAVSWLFCQCWTHVLTVIDFLHSSRQFCEIVTALLEQWILWRSCR